MQKEISHFEKYKSETLGTSSNQKKIKDF